MQDPLLSLLLFKTKQNGKKVLSFGNPKELEAYTIAEIKLLSYLEILERLMVIIEVSYMLKTAKVIQSKKR